MSWDFSTTGLTTSTGSTGLDAGNFFVSDFSTSFSDLTAVEGVAEGVLPAGDVAVVSRPGIAALAPPVMSPAPSNCDQRL